MMNENSEVIHKLNTISNESSQLQQLKYQRSSIHEVQPGKGVVKQGKVKKNNQTASKKQENKASSAFFNKEGSHSSNEQTQEQKWNNKGKAQEPPLTINNNINITTTINNNYNFPPNSAGLGPVQQGYPNLSQQP